jgi:hypothetical protein
MQLEQKNAETKGQEFWNKKFWNQKFHYEFSVSQTLSIRQLFEVQ